MVDGNSSRQLVIPRTMQAAACKKQPFAHQQPARPRFDLPERHPPTVVGPRSEARGKSTDQRPQQHTTPTAQQLTQHSPPPVLPPSGAARPHTSSSGAAGRPLHIGSSGCRATHLAQEQLSTTEGDCEDPGLAFSAVARVGVHIGADGGVGKRRKCAGEAAHAVGAGDVVCRGCRGCEWEGSGRGEGSKRGVRHR